VVNLIRSTLRLRVAAATWCVAVSLLALAAPHARAVIDRPYPLDRAVADNDAIVVAKVDRLDPARPSVVLSVETDLKGTPAARRIPVLLAAESPIQSKLVLDRLREGLPVVLFMTEGPQADQMLILAYTEGTWFQVIGQKDGAAGGALRGGLTHVEPYLRRTYSDSTPKLVQLIGDIQAGKAPAPPIDPSASPGVGPPVAAGEPATKLYPVPAEANAAATPSTPTPPQPNASRTPDQNRPGPASTDAAPHQTPVWLWATVAFFIVVALAFTAVAFKRRSGPPSP
jgi:hypothetical protein